MGRERGSGQWENAAARECLRPGGLSEYIAISETPAALEEGVSSDDSQRLTGLLAF